MGASPEWLTPGVRGIGAASFLADVGHEIPTALLPALLTSTLGAPAAALGLIEGVSDGLAGAAKFAGGAIADDPRRRRAAAVGGYSATAVLASLTGAATAVWQVGALRAGAWAARGLRVPARNALLADIVPARAYGRAYGFERMMDNLGAIGGPLLALGLVALFDVRTAILLSVIPGLLAALAIVYAIRKAPRAEQRERRSLRVRVRPVLHGELGVVLAVIAAFELGNVAATLMILRANQQLQPAHSAHDAAQLALGLYIAYNVAATLASFPAGRASDRLGRQGPTTVMALGVAVFALAYAALSLDVSTVATLAPGFVLAGVGIACVETAESAAVAAFATEDLRGSAFGLLATVQSLGNFAASGIAGLIWSTVGPEAAFDYLVVWMIVAAAGFAALLTRSQVSPRRAL